MIEVDTFIQIYPGLLGGGALGLSLGVIKSDRKSSLVSLKIKQKIKQIGRKT